MSDINPGSFVTWRETLAHTAVDLNDRIVAKWLCEHASGCDGQDFTEILDEFVTERSARHLNSMLERITAGEPVQYAMGRWAFRKLDLMVDRRVLIPRPETELIVDHVIAHLAGRSNGITIVDLGTGSGAIGLSLLSELPFESAVVWMTDDSADALDVARANGTGIGRAAVGARFVHGLWCDPLPDALRSNIDVVVSNPPYIATDDVEIEQNVNDWEPHHALFAGEDGLDAFRIIAAQSIEWLRPQGMLIVEMGHKQGSEVCQLFTDNGFQDVHVLTDLAGHDRFVQGVKPV